tara:strand:- start:50 stop:607 length:558 start_codon:yes stop_codon:yes gene_type:complete
MAIRVSISARDLPGVKKIVKKKIVKSLAEGNALGNVLRSQAVARMKAGRDSTHTYPDLWANEVPGHYRAGGQPLQNTGRLMAALHSSTETRSGGVSVSLLDGTGYGVYHQSGFKTDGPNYIPLSLKGARQHVNGRNPEEEGLVEGKDYIIAWNGVDVPQRKIYNMPPENKKELGEAVVNAIKNMR